MTHAVAFDDLLRFTRECLQRVGLSSANARQDEDSWHLMPNVR